MVRQLALALLVVPFLGSGCVAMSPEPARDALKLEVRQADAADWPAVELTIRNEAGRSVGISKSFGVGAHRWIGLELETGDHRFVPYPEGIPDFLLGTPDYECLLPGEVVVLRVNLNDWRVLLGGEGGEERFSFRVEPGTIRARLLYTDHDRDLRVPCPQLVGQAASDWTELDFSLPDPDQE